MKISIKKTIIKLEKHIRIKFPEYEAKFYSNGRNSCIHMGFNKAIFAYSNFQDLMKEINLFLNEHIPNKFSGNFPRLIDSTKWKFDYIASTKKWLKKLIILMYQNLFQIIFHGMKEMDLIHGMSK